MPWLNRTTGTLHRRWQCVSWDARQHGHEVEEIDVEDVAELEGVTVCGNCISRNRARHVWGWEGQPA